MCDKFKEILGFKDRFRVMLGDYAKKIDELVKENVKPIIRIKKARQQRDEAREREK